MSRKRKPGISVLIPTQNEEAVVESCLRSFLDFGDELIVVDNGSADRTKEIVRDLAARHPRKIRFFDVPDLPDLVQNRRFALAHTSCQWIVRADSDYVCYTDGDLNILTFRDHLLKRKPSLRPEAVSVPQVNVFGDFWYTGKPMRPGGYRANPERQHVPGVMQPPMVRFYRHFPLFQFVRRGRRETVRFRAFFRVTRWEQPLWMHCNIKSDMNLFFRSERTDWRELGDFRRYPTLQSYIEAHVEPKYGTRDLAVAARLYVERHVLPYLEPYDPRQHYPYPSLVREQMERNPVYRIRPTDTGLTRDYLGVVGPGTGAASA